jgi:uncharacterized protein YndB with AHSA1/START domain
MTQSDSEIVISRRITAPAILVWKVWTDPAHISHWWGPNGFTTTTSAFDFKPGGVWRFVMHGPDGTDYENKITYLDIVESERIVYKHSDGEENLKGINFETTVSFKQENDITEVTLRMLFPSKEERDTVVENYGAIEGGEQTLNRLADFVAQL